LLAAAGIAVYLMLGLAIMRSTLLELLSLFRPK
jgi:hypothetical protein